MVNGLAIISIHLISRKGVVRKLIGKIHRENQKEKKLTEPDIRHIFNIRAIFKKMNILRCMNYA